MDKGVDSYIGICLDWLSYILWVMDCTRSSKTLRWIGILLLTVLSGIAPSAINFIGGYFDSTLLLIP